MRVEERSGTGLAGRVRLRPTSEGDLDFVLSEENDEKNRPFIGRWPRGRHLEALADEGVEHSILEDQEGTSVGYTILTGLEDPGRILCLKRLMVSEKGRGYGRAALRLLGERAFGGLGAHRLWLDVKEGNARARGLYESEGFVKEGVLRDSLWTGEEYESLVVMSILESEYRA
ncbi:MAG TPA: GNAT family protein [Rubrobacter sp.]|nr:GNAT family protein [Rubrobacter sp.]